MTKIIKIIPVLVFLLTSQVNSAQYHVQERGDQLFNQFSYSKAIHEYERMLSNNYKEDYANQRLAECYLMMRDFKKSIPYFKSVITSPTIPTDYYFKYGMALYSIGDKKGAEKWLKKYKKYNKNDSRVKKFLKDGSLASVVFNSRQRYDVKPVAFNSTESDFGAYAKEGNIYYASSRRDQVNGEAYGWNDEPWLDLFVISEDNQEQTPIKLPGEINTEFHESNLVFSTDYKNDTVIYFTRNNYYKKKKSLSLELELNLKIYSGIQEEGEWVENRNLTINGDNYSTGHPSVSKDRKYLYFTSDRPGGFGGTDIYFSVIHDRGGIGKPVNAGPTVNTEGNEMFPFVNAEGVLFFSSDGHVGFGQSDIFSTVLNQEGEIVDVINLGNSINTSADDFGYFEYESGGTGYISSNREGGVGSDDIYKFQFTPSLSVEGYITDAINLQPLDNVAVTILDQISKTKIAELTTDENGYYKTFINRNTTYMIEAIRKTHPHKSEYFSTTKTPRTTQLITRNVSLDPVLDLKILADLDKIYFDFNKSDIRPDAAIELNKVVKLMTKTYPEMVIRLEAHTDPVGSNAYNDRLSERRAKSSYEYLIANGVPESRILSYKGFGKRKTINGCTGKMDCTNEELELNRRTEFPIIQIKGPVNDSNDAISKRK